eukprot:Gb_29283 [translate_table: standard]
MGNPTSIGAESKRSQGQNTRKKGINDKAMAQLEKSVVTKLEPTLSRQIQTQFQASGKQALQDALRSCFEVSVVPAIKLSCRSMFEQIDSAFQKGMAEHTSTAQQQFVLSHTVLASTLQVLLSTVFLFCNGRVLKQTQMLDFVSMIVVYLLTIS